jgi:hypothetical protein
MKRYGLAFVAAMSLVAFSSISAQEKLRPVPGTPAWQKLRSLAGQWEGFAGEGEQRFPATAEVRMTGDGSAVMHVLGRDTPHEMVTMFHPDGERLLATHYCAAHNQPRMAMVAPPAPDQLAFEFVDGTNIGPGDGYMKRLVITFKDADHHDEAWSSVQGGKESPPMVFRFARKK